VDSCVGACPCRRTTVRPGEPDSTSPGHALAHDLEITQIERDQEKITNCHQMWAADVCSSLRGKAEPIGFDDVVYILRYRYSTGNLQLVIMPAKQEIVAEVKVLFPTVAGDYVRESSAQASPPLCALLPRRNLGHLETRHCHQEWSRKVRPSRITIEVSTMKQVPRRIHRVARKRRSRVRAF